MLINKKYQHLIVYFSCLLIIFQGCDNFTDTHSKSDSAALYRASQAYLKSNKPGNDTDKGIDLLIRSAEGGYVLAQNKLGFLYAEGKRVPRDLSSALHFYNLAAENGFAVSQYNLAEMYRTGVATEKNEEMAFQWYLKSALQAYPAAMFRTSEAFRLGQGIAPDPVRAFAWMQLTIKTGFPISMETHAQMIETMTPEQLEQANQYFYKIAKAMH